ncbi:ORF6N domain-containing protein, partial [Escherichia coli]|nr:ORF6N domain-containing protein [Escherichia coli]
MPTHHLFRLSNTYARYYTPGCLEIKMNTVTINNKQFPV